MSGWTRARRSCDRPLEEIGKDPSCPRPPGLAKLTPARLPHELTGASFFLRRFSERGREPDCGLHPLLFPHRPDAGLLRGLQSSDVAHVLALESSEGANLRRDRHAAPACTPAGCAAASPSTAAHAATIQSFESREPLAQRGLLL